MHDQQIHPFPFHPFPKEIRWERVEILSISTPIPVIPTHSGMAGTGGNEWERVTLKKPIHPMPSIFGGPNF